ncbi:MAG TPA: arsenite methyltransferase [Solirubrobacteraceae bacterium]|nr:arsenite methyltransferase [Solirubrobacteraceae bacterium]
MAEVAGDCCSPGAQETCCEPEAKAACCAGAGAGTCGCDAGTAASGVREAVRERYASAARAVLEAAELVGGDPQSSCGGGVSLTDEQGEQVFGGALYGSTEGDPPEEALAASLGCGVPTAVADLQVGETVLDLGSGAGADVLISAKRVGPCGRAIGLDMTDEMLDLARRNVAAAGAANVKLLKGHIEEIPLPDGSVDVVISNCVINLSADKPSVLREAARVLRPGGRFAVSDVIADARMDEQAKADMASWTGCIAGALTREEFQRALADAGLVDIEIRESHRVHANAASAIIRARKPGTAWARWRRSTSTIRRRSTATGRRASGAPGTSTSHPTVSNGAGSRTARWCPSCSAP